MTPRELHNAVGGYFENNDFKNRESWERARMVSFSSISPHLSKDSKIKTPIDFVKFAWDKKQSVKITPEEARELKRKTNLRLGIKKTR